MNTPNSKKLKIGFLTALCLGIAASAQGTVVLSDDFETGTPGANLNGSAISDYSSDYYATAPTWAAAGTKYSNPLGYITVSSPYNGLGNVAAPDFSTLEPNSILTLQADVTLGTYGWVSLNFLHATGTTANPTYFGTDNPVLVRIDSAGQVIANKNGYNSIIGSNTISGFVSTQSYQLKAVYDLGAGTLDMYVDGSLMGSYTVGALNDSTIGAVGFYFTGDGSSSGGSIDNFSLTVIPESSSYGLLAALGALGLLAARLRRK